MTPEVKATLDRLGLLVWILGVLAWMSVVVGPWWIGVILFLLGAMVNLAAKLVKAEREGK